MILFFCVSNVSFSQSIFADLLRGVPQMDTGLNMKWSESEIKRILFVQADDPDHIPQIEIKEGMLRAFGKVVKTESVEKEGMTSSYSYMSSYSRSIELPRDIDQSNPQIEKVEKGVKITFKKTKNSKPPRAKKPKDLKQLKGVRGDVI